MLSLDKAILERGSAVQKRLLALSEKVGKTTPALQGSDTPFAKGELTVLVPAQKDEVRKLSEYLTIHAFGGNKILQLWKMWREGERVLRGRTAPALQGSGTPLIKGDRGRYDLVTVQDAYFLGFLAVRLGKKFSVPVEVQIHGFEKRVGGRARLAKFVLAHATKIRVVSIRLQKELYSIFHIPYSRIYVLPVVTQVEASERIQKRKTVPYPFTFLTVGRLVPVKNIGLQIRAFAKLVKEIPHVRLLIVGDGAERKNLEREAKSLKLESSVVFEGEQKEVGKYYEEADAFLLTSDYEGWGRVTLEAATHKLPIIMTDVGLAREVIVNEESGLIIPVGDEAELVRAMRDLLDKPELRTQLGEGALKAFKTLPGRETQIEKQVTEWNSLR